MSPSQSATTTSDTSGRFSFISLAPDTYTVSVPATDTRDAASVSGITVQADQTISVTLTQPSKLKVIGAVTSRAASALVKPGTTADVYSINPLTQDKASALGGGGTLNSAWSAISSVPGVFVAPNQGGYIGAGPTLSIRGGDYNQVGYEVDGVPVNRSFDNYPSGSLSSLGQQELQVYTGATPANAEASGLSGYINQVIRTGTSPATRNLTLAIGTPALYNKIAFEAGGANPARTFSYYLGAGAFNQAFRYYDQYNGASLQQVYGMPVSTCPAAGTPGFSPGSSPGCFAPNGVPYTNAATPSYVLSPYVNDSIAGVRTRDTVLNVHFGIPQKNGNKDDVQVLFDNNFIENSYYNSTNDQGGAAFLAFNGATTCPVGSPCYADGNVLTGIPRATVLPVGFTGAPGAVSYYLYPDSPGGRALASSIAPDRRDAFNNNQSIVKVQYQKNFGTSAFLRVYGYTYYSDWLQNGPQSAQQTFLGAIPSQYLLSSHTRGVSATFSDQLNSQHLLTAQAAYVTATSLRDNNTSGGLGSLGLNTSAVAYLVNGNNPYNGTCYTAGGTPAPGCNFGTSPFQTFTFNNLRNNTVVQPTPGATCGGGPCQYVVVNDGIRASYNSIVPKFYSASLTDQFTPTSRLHVNLGLRFDRFEFHEPSTFDSNARTLYYNAYNTAHPTTPLTNSDINGNVAGFSVWQPRVGLTYSLNPATVIRASYGRYAQPPNAAFEQYNFLQANSIPNLLGFQAVGLPATPSHVIRPEISNNYDLSFERQFGRDTSIKVTPFLRKTQDQIQQFYLDPRVNFVSGLNVGRQTSQGVEFEADKGDFSRNGIAARVTFTYTNSYITYGNSLPNGQSVISNFNTAITNYNAFTAAGGGAACYAAVPPGASPVPAPSCPAGSIANPYYNAPFQPLMDVNGNYATYSLFPSGAVGSAPYQAFGAPYVATVLAQYKRGPLAIAPAIQFSGGTRYGVPIGSPGIIPGTCSAGVPGVVAGDPRYPYGAPGGSPYDAAACASGLGIPNPFTGRFDNLGAFVMPNNLQLHTQVTWDVNKRITLVGTFANIVNRCWGGTQTPWNVNHSCGYTFVAGGNAGINPVGNVFNPGDNIQPFLRSQYAPNAPQGPQSGVGGLPFNMFFEARIKI